MKDSVADEGEGPGKIATWASGVALFIPIRSSVGTAYNGCDTLEKTVLSFPS